MLVKNIIPGSDSSAPSQLAAVNGAVEFYAFDGAEETLFRSDGTAAGTIELDINVQDTLPLGVTETPDGDFNGDSHSDILWQNASGQASIWDMNQNALTPPRLVSTSWKAIGSGDFNGDSHSDVPMAERENGQAFGLGDGRKQLNRRRPGQPQSGTELESAGKTAISTATASPISFFKTR